MGDRTRSVSGLLRAWGRGDREARDELVPLVYRELRRRAAAYLRHERSDHTLQPTALVHEVYLRLTAQDRVAWQNRAHFFAIAAQMIRRILVDHARGVPLAHEESDGRVGSGRRSLPAVAASFIRPRHARPLARPVDGCRP